MKEINKYEALIPGKDLGAYAVEKRIILEGVPDIYIGLGLLHSVLSLGTSPSFQELAQGKEPSVTAHTSHH